jgi:IS1 family transposase
MYVLQADKQHTILNLLVEGNSIRSCERLTGVHRDTICRLLVRTGDKCRDFLDAYMRSLNLRHLECDEIWTFVGIKQKRIPEGTNDSRIGDQYLYVAFDEETKLVPTFIIGKRTREMAERFMLDLAGRIVHSVQVRPQVSTDGFAPYPSAVDLAFARECKFGQLIKSFNENKEQPGRYGPPAMVQTDRRPLWGITDPFTICTSHVERNNLTIRTFMRRFTRLSLGFSKKLENLAAAVALHMAYYNFCWRNRLMRITAAMAAHVTDELWDFDRLMREIGM